MSFVFSSVWFISSDVVHITGVYLEVLVLELGYKKPIKSKFLKMQNLAGRKQKIS